MNPFSTRSRRPIEWTECILLEKNQKAKSLISRSGTDPQEAAERIGYLLNLENNTGFVYFGERLWLEFNQQYDPFTPYDGWALRQLRFLFSDSFVHRLEMGGCWESTTSDLAYFWLPSELLRGAVDIFDVDIRLAGTASGIGEQVASNAFNTLHNLVYFLHDAGECAVRAYGPNHDLSLDHLDFLDGSNWRLGLSGQHGSCGWISYDGQRRGNFYL